MKRSSIIHLLLLLSLVKFSSTADCFGWSTTKRASYSEVLPLLLYFDSVNWINLNPTASCNFKSYGAVFLKFYSSDLSATYQKYQKSGTTCTLDSTSYTYTSAEWLYSNDILANNVDCGYYVTITNSNSAAAKMFSVIRTAAEYIKSSVGIITGAAVAFYLVNL